MEAIVAYFSATGVTRDRALEVAKLLNADTLRIMPEVDYTSEDLNWIDKNCRSSKEMHDDVARPAILTKSVDLSKYDTVLLGFPIWWYTAPRIINSFIEHNNLLGKNIYVFATSGGSNALRAFQDLKNLYPSLNFVDHKILTEYNAHEVVDWVNK